MSFIQGNYLKTEFDYYIDRSLYVIVKALILGCEKYPTKGFCKIYLKTFFPDLNVLLYLT
jgi:hypothetical protein